MNQRYIYHALFFIGALLLLNFFFHLHISIIGSVVLTIVLNLVFNAAQPKFR